MIVIQEVQFNAEWHSIQWVAWSTRALGLDSWSPLSLVTQQQLYLSCTEPVIIITDTVTEYYESGIVIILVSTFDVL